MKPMTSSLNIALAPNTAEPAAGAGGGFTMHGRCRSGWAAATDPTGNLRAFSLHAGDIAAVVAGGSRRHGGSSVSSNSIIDVGRGEMLYRFDRAGILAAAIGDRKWRGQCQRRRRRQWRRCLPRLAASVVPASVVTTK